MAAERELEDGEDLFTSTVSTLESSPSSPEPASLPAEDISANSNGSKPVEVVLDDDREDLFAEATEEVSLDSPERELILSSEPSPAVTPVTPTTLIAPRIESKSISAPVIFDRSRDEKWEDAQITLLKKKRETEAKMMVANKPDKIQQAKNEIREEIEEWEAKVQQGERDFEQISKTIRKEVGRFEKERVKDFKAVIIKYLESLVQTQQQLIKYWEAFLPEAKAIA